MHDNNKSASPELAARMIVTCEVLLHLRCDREEWRGVKVSAIVTQDGRRSTCGQRDPGGWEPGFPLARVVLTSMTCKEDDG